MSDGVAPQRRRKVRLNQETSSNPAAEPAVHKGAY
jgi:hypothetical protein